MDNIVPIAISNGGETQVQQDKPESTFSQYVSSAFNLNITGHKWLNDNGVKTHYDKEPFTSEEANNAFAGTNLPLKQITDIINTSNNIEEVKNRRDYNMGLIEDMQRIESLGKAGYALSIGVSLLDAPSWIFGAGVGEIAKAGIVAYRLGKTASILAQGASGAVTGAGSMYMLEKSLGQDLSPEQAGISAGLGFGIGVAMSRMAITDPQNFQEVGSVMNKGAMPSKSPSKFFNFMMNDSDKMKQSTNPKARETGYKSTIEVSDNNRVVGETVAEDYLDEYGKVTQNGIDNAFSEVKAQEDKSGVKFTEDDYQQVNHHGLDVENKLNQDKKSFMAEKTKQIEADNKKEIDTAVKEVENNYEHKLTPKTKKPTAKSIRELEAKKKAKIDEIKSKQNKAKEEINKKINEEYKARSEKVKDDLIKNIPDRYRGVVTAISDMNRIFGKEIDSTNMDGLQGKINTNFHWTRAYDIDKIIANPDGARVAFENGIKANVIGKINDKLAKKIKKQANSIVHKLVTQKNLFEAINLSNSIIEKALKKMKLNTGRLKGRTLDLDGTYLTDYMSNNMHRNMSTYGKAIGGKLTAKKVFNIDKDFQAKDYMIKNKFDSKDSKLFSNIIQSIHGTRNINEHSNTLGAKVVRMLNKVNYVNYGGYFGLNTLSDLSNIVYNFGFSRTMKYLSDDVINTLKRNGSAGSKLAHYMGLASESSTQGYAGNFNGNHIDGIFGVGKIEKGLDVLGGLTSKLSGMNMVIDFMDKTVGISSLDYMFTAKRGTKFIKTMNGLGLSPEDIDLLRASKDIVTFKNGFISKVNLDKLSGSDLGIKLHRALQRAARNTVLRASALETPSFLIEIMGSKSLASTLFQFLRFPVVAYNKVTRNMIHNFDMADAIVSTATGAFMLGMVTQIRDIGRDKKQFDLSTKEGSMNMISNVVDRMPYLAPVGLLQTHVDMLGRIKANLTGEEYKSYDKVDSHLGISLMRVSDLYDSGKRVLSGNASGRDAIKMKSFMSTNMFWLQPLNYMLNDKIKEEMR